MGVTFNEATKALFDGKNFPVLATINADGSVQTSVVWAKRDGDAVLFATVRGRAEITEEGGRELINELSHKYDGKDFRTEPPEVVRVVVRVVPDKITGYAA